MKWINTKDEIIRVNESEDGLLKMWFFDFLDWWLPKMLRRHYVKKQVRKEIQ